MRRLAILFGVALAWPLAAGGQGGEVPVFGDLVEVTVVNLTVTVSARDGEPVTGLGRDDFEILEDGKRVKITHFAEIRREAAAAADAAPEVAAAPAAAPPPEIGEAAFLVLYVDQVHTAPHHRNRVFRQMEAFVRSRTGRGDWMAVVAYDRGLRVETPPTTDPEAVLAGLARLEDSAAGTELATARRQAMRDLKETYRAALERAIGGGPCADKDRMGSIAEGYAAQARGEVGAALRALGELTTSLGGLDGRKALVYVSDGLPFAAGEELFWLIEEWCPLGIGPDGLPSTQAGSRWSSLSAGDVVDAVTRQANRNGVTLHALQASGLPGTSTADPEVGEWFLSATPRVDFMRRTNLQTTLSKMADATGGRALLESNDVAASLAGLARDLDHAYSLGYTPKRKGDRGEHRIEVRVKRPGVRVRHRAGHRDLSRHEQVANRTVAALWYRLDYNPLGVEVGFGASGPLGDGTWSLPVLLDLPLELFQLIPQDERYAGQMSLFFAREEPDGRKPPARRSIVPLRIVPEKYLNAIENPYFHGVKLVLQPGRHRLAIGVLDDVGGAYAVLYREVEVGGEPGSAAAADAGD